MYFLARKVEVEHDFDSKCVKDLKRAFLNEGITARCLRCRRLCGRSGRHSLQYYTMANSLPNVAMAALPALYNAMWTQSAYPKSWNQGDRHSATKGSLQSRKLSSLSLIHI